MSLPVPPLATDVSDVGGESVPITSLTRDDVARLANMGDDGTEAAEAFLISKGTGLTVDEAIAWRKQVSAPVAGKLLEDIAVLSGIRPARDEDGKIVRDSKGNR